MPEYIEKFLALTDSRLKPGTIRRVRTPEGAKYYGVPIGTPIKAAKAARAAIIASKGLPTNGAKPPTDKPIKVVTNGVTQTYPSGSIVLHGKKFDSEVAPDKYVRIGEDDWFHQTFQGVVHLGPALSGVLEDGVQDDGNYDPNSNLVMDASNHDMGDQAPNLSNKLPPDNPDNPDLTDEHGDEKHQEIDQYNKTHEPAPTEAAPKPAEPSTTATPAAAPTPAPEQASAPAQDTSGQPPVPFGGVQATPDELIEAYQALEDSYAHGAGSGAVNQIGPAIKKRVPNNPLVGMDPTAVMNDWNSKLPDGATPKKKKQAVIESLADVIDGLDLTDEQRAKFDKSHTSFGDKVSGGEDAKGKVRDPFSNPDAIEIEGNLYKPGKYSRTGADAKVFMILDKDGKATYTDKSGTPTKISQSTFVKQYNKGIKKHFPIDGAAPAENSPNNAPKAPATPNAPEANAPDAVDAPKATAPETAAAPKEDIKPSDVAPEPKPVDTKSPAESKAEPTPEATKSEEAPKPVAEKAPEPQAEATKEKVVAPESKPEAAATPEAPKESKPEAATATPEAVKPKEDKPTPPKAVEPPVEVPKVKAVLKYAHKPHSLTSRGARFSDQSTANVTIQGTSDEIDKIEAKLPKSVKAKKFNYSKDTTRLEIFADLGDNKAKGGTNEAGIKRINTTLDKLEALGVTTDIHNLGKSNNTLQKNKISRDQYNSLLEEKAKQGELYDKLAGITDAQIEAVKPGKYEGQDKEDGFFTVHSDGSVTDTFDKTLDSTNAKNVKSFVAVGLLTPNADAKAPDVPDGTYVQSGHGIVVVKDGKFSRKHFSPKLGDYKITPLDEEDTAYVKHGILSGSTIPESVYSKIPDGIYTDAENPHNAGWTLKDGKWYYADGKEIYEGNNASYYKGVLDGRYVSVNAQSEEDFSKLKPGMYANNSGYKPYELKADGTVLDGNGKQLQDFNANKIKLGIKNGDYEPAKQKDVTPVVPEASVPETTGPKQGIKTFDAETKQWSEKTDAALETPYGQAPEQTAEEKSKEISAESNANGYSILPKHKQGESGDGTYINGMWGKYGAAGVMLEHTDESGEKRYLLVQRGPGVSSNRGKWQLPGGAINENETDQAGAARELMEELQAPEGYLGTLSPAGEHVYNHAGGWHYNNLAATVPNMFAPKVDGGETSDAQWFTKEQIDKLDLVPAFKGNVAKVLEKFDKKDESSQNISKPKAEELAKVADVHADPIKVEPQVSEPAPGKTIISVDGEEFAEVPTGYGRLYHGANVDSDNAKVKYWVVTQDHEAPGGHSFKKGDVLKLNAYAVGPEKQNDYDAEYIHSLINKGSLVEEDMNGSKEAAELDLAPNTPATDLDPEKTETAWLNGVDMGKVPSGGTWYKSPNDAIYMRDKNGNIWSVNVPDEGAQPILDDSLHAYYSTVFDDIDSGSAEGLAKYYTKSDTPFENADGPIGDPVQSLMDSFVEDTPELGNDEPVIQTQYKSVGNASVTNTYGKDQNGKFWLLNDDGSIVDGPDGFVYDSEAQDIEKNIQDGTFFDFTAGTHKPISMHGDQVAYLPKDGSLYHTKNTSTDTAPVKFWVSKDGNEIKRVSSNGDILDLTSDEWDSAKIVMVPDEGWNGKASDPINTDAYLNAMGNSAGKPNTVSYIVGGNKLGPLPAGGKLYALDSFSNDNQSFYNVVVGDEDKWYLLDGDTEEISVLNSTGATVQDIKESLAGNGDPFETPYKLVDNPSFVEHDPEGIVKTVKVNLLGKKFDVPAGGVLWHVKGHDASVIVAKYYEHPTEGVYLINKHGTELLSPGEANDYFYADKVSYKTEDGFDNGSGMSAPSEPAIKIQVMNDPDPVKAYINGHEVGELPPYGTAYYNTSVYGDVPNYPSSYVYEDQKGQLHLVSADGVSLKDDIAFRSAFYEQREAGGFAKLDSVYTQPNETKQLDKITPAEELAVNEVLNGTQTNVDVPHTVPQNGEPIHLPYGEYTTKLTVPGGGKYLVNKGELGKILGDDKGELTQAMVYLSPEGQMFLAAGSEGLMELTGTNPMTIHFHDQIHNGIYTEHPKFDQGYAPKMVPITLKGKGVGYVPAGGQVFYPNGKTADTANVKWYMKSDGVYLQVTSDGVSQFSDQETVAEVINGYGDSDHAFVEDSSFDNGTLNQSMQLPVNINGVAVHTVPYGGNVFVNVGSDPDTTVKKYFLHPNGSVYLINATKMSKLEPNGAEGFKNALKAGQFKLDTSYAAIKDAAPDVVKKAEADLVPVHINGQVMGHVKPGGTMYYRTTLGVEGGAYTDADASISKYYKDPDGVWYDVTNDRFYQVEAKDTFDYQSDMTQAVSEGAYKIDDSFGSVDKSAVQTDPTGQWVPVSFDGNLVGEVPAGGVRYWDTNAIFEGDDGYIAEDEALEHLYRAPSGKWYEINENGVWESNKNASHESSNKDGYYAISSNFDSSPKASTYKPGPKTPSGLPEGNYQLSTGGDIVVRPDGHVEYRETPTSQVKYLDTEGMKAAFKNGIVLDKYGSTVPLGGNEPDQKFKVFNSDKAFSADELKQFLTKIVTAKEAHEYTAAAGSISVDSKLATAYHHSLDLPSTPEGVGAAYISQINQMLDAHLSDKPLPTSIPGAPAKIAHFDVSPEGWAINPLDHTKFEDVAFGGLENTKAYIAKIHEDSGGLIGNNSEHFQEGDAFRWMRLYDKGKMDLLWKLENSLGDNSDDGLPLHPGAPGNPNTHHIYYQPFTKGQVPAGKQIEAYKHIEYSYDFTKNDTDGYLQAAGMTNSQWLSEEEKDKWVSAHHGGLYAMVSQFNQNAEIRKSLGDPPLSGPLGSKGFLPTADKTYSPLVDAGVSPELWHLGAINQFLGDNGLAESTRNLDAHTKMGIIEAHLRDAQMTTEDKKYDAWAEPDGLKLKDAGTEGIVFGNNTGVRNVTDQFGDKYIFKPELEGSESFRMEIEHSMNLLARDFGFSTPDSKIVTHNGQRGQLQRHVGVATDLNQSQDFSKLTAQQRRDVAMEHVLDWMLENDDTRSSNMKLTADGRAVGIDKGRAWAQSGNWEGLSPHATGVGGVDLLYTKLYDDISNGVVSANDAEDIYRSVSLRAQEMEKIPDSLVRTRFNEAFANRPGDNNEALIDKAIARKNSLADDADKLWSRIFINAGLTKPERPVATMTNDRGDVLHTGFTRDFVESVKANKYHGKAVFFGGTDLEDMHILFHTEKSDLKNGTSKDVIRGEAHISNKDTFEKVRSFLKSKVVGGGDPAVADPHNSLPDQHDKWYKVDRAASTVKTHLVDGQYNQDTLDKAWALKAELTAEIENIQAKKSSPAWEALSPKTWHDLDQTVKMNTQLLSQLKEVESAMAEKRLPEAFAKDKFSYEAFKAPEAPKTTTESFKVIKEQAHRAMSTNGYSESSIDADGNTHTSETGTLEDEFQGNRGTQYTAILATGERIEFRGGRGDQIKASQHGQLNFVIPDTANTEQSMTRIRAALAEMGVNLNEAEPNDYELFYWRHLKSIMDNRVDSRSTTGTYKEFHKALKPSLINKGGPAEIEMWRNAFSKFPSMNRAKVDKFVQDGGHLPKFSHFNLRNPNEATSTPYWNRFDVEASDHGDLMPLSATNSHVLATAQAGGTYATAVRMRQWGTWSGGSSKEADQGTGAGFFSFLRQNQNISNYGNYVYVDPAALARTSTYAFNGDEYGNVDERKDYSPFEFSKVSQLSQSNNEVMVKNGLSLLDDIIAMSFDSESERNKAVAHLKALDIHMIRGVPVEDRLFYGSLSKHQKELLGIEHRKPATPGNYDSPSEYNSHYEIDGWQ